MATIVTRPPTPKPIPTASAVRIRFVASAPAGVKVRRTFQQPHAAVAIEESIDLIDPPIPKAWPEPTDRCDVVIMPLGMAGDSAKKFQTWIAPPEQPVAVAAVSVERDGVTVQWRPGQAIVQGGAERREEMLAALTDFAFYEGELRSLERQIEARQTQAKADVVLAHRIRNRDRKEWARIQETMEFFAQMRLTFARLEPFLAKGSRSLPAEARRVMTRLIDKADVEYRLEALNDRLETMEELYEGANDRVADYRSNRKGHVLEIGIIVLLLFEVLLMVGEIGLHYYEYQRDARIQPAVETRGLVPTEDLSEEFRATITKVADGKVTFTRTMFNRDARKIQKSDEQTLPVADPVLIVRGTFDPNGGSVEAGDPIPGGLKNDRFHKIGENGLRAMIVTDAENKKIVEIYVLSSTIRRP